MDREKPYKVIPLSHMSRQDLEFARRLRIIVEPDFNKMKAERGIGPKIEVRDSQWLDLGSADVLPAGNVRSQSCIRLETRRRRGS